MMRLFNILFLFLSLSVQAQTFSFTPVTTDFVRPGAGFEFWNDQNGPYGTMHIPVNGSPQIPMDAYFRFGMNDFFANPTVAGDSTIIYTRFDQKVNAARAAGQVFSFRIMSVCNNCDIGNNTLVSYNGGFNSYPKFLHDLMQAEAVKDWLCTNGDQIQWIPNWNSAQYHRWIGKLMTAIKNHINTTNTTTGSVPFSSIVRLYDIGFYGAYSEQHSAGILANGQTTANYPAGTFGTAASLDSIVSKQVSAMRGNGMLFTIPFNSLDAIWLNNTNNPVAYGQYLLDHPDSIGFRWDHLSDDQGYDHSYWENNTRMGASYLAKIINRWRYSPIRGEPPGYVGSPANLAYFPQQVLNIHLNSFGNGNYASYTNANTTAADNARLAAKNAGYRLRLTGGNVTTAGSITINLNWINEGTTPTYDSWTVKYLIKSGATTVATLTSSFNPLRFLPTAASQTKTDNFALPAIPAGNYTLWVRVDDPLNYRLPMPLAITGRQSDGSYFLANINIAGGGNILPTANAGPNQSTTGTSVVLTGVATDADGTITNYQWTQVSGPNTASITTPLSTSTGVTGLVAGTYTFDYTVTDNSGGTASDQVQVNKSNPIPPTANAGANQTITLPTSQVTVNGSGTDDIGIVSYAWSKVAGPASFSITSPTSASTTITALTQGTYTFRLTVTDGSGLTGTDDMNVIVNPGNTAPVSNAGSNQTITLPTSTVALSGSLSSDDAGITAYLWTQVGGPITATIATPTTVGTNISGLTTVGFYIFRLRVEDVAGLSSTDDVQITVLAAPNGGPTANAGLNQTITLPTSSVTLNGSGSTDDVGIVTYLWTKISGTGGSIATPNNVSTLVSGLTAGTYVYRLTVTDGGGLTSTDDIQITVNSAPNTAPVANAGANQTITLPTSSVSVSGSASTDNIGIVSYAWARVSGPTTFTIVSPTSVNTNITGLVQGTYIFRLTVTDGGGLTGTDDVQITVNAAPNVAPVANAGPNQNITLPTSSVTLTSAASTDDVGIVTRLWTKVSGVGGTITTPGGITTTVTGLTAGAYQFRVLVTDGGGLTSQDEVDIIVNPAPNAAPISNAGPNQSITLPTSSVTLSGSGTDDVAIVGYLWTKVSGTGGTITSPTTASTSVTGLTAGTYVFRLRVTDGGGLTATDDIQVIVNPAPNNVPVAAAGSNQTITLPTSSVTLNGGSSTDDVSIASYLWTKVSGTGGLIVSPTASSTSVTGLVQGYYTFRLTVTDGFGLTDTDDVTITVNSQSSGDKWWWFWRWFKKR